MSQAEQDLYQEVVLEHKRAPRNYGHLAHPTHQAEGTNPSCGDRIAVELALEHGTVRDIAFTGQGCAICMASTSMMTEAVKGREVAAAQALQQHFRAVLTGEEAPEAAPLGKLVSLAGVRQYPSRIKCALLGWHAARWQAGLADLLCAGDFREYRVGVALEDGAGITLPAGTRLRLRFCEYNAQARLEVLIDKAEFPELQPAPEAAGARWHYGVQPAP